MIEQYPYKLFVLTMTDGGRDEDGFVLPSTEEWIEVGECRDQAAGSGRVIATESHEVTAYSWMISAPLSIPDIEKTSTVRVMDGEFVRVEAQVIRFDRNQLHCRIWV